MKISVVMTTYNGARYLHTQLQSIANQLRLPDELIVCDDASSDTTTEITRSFTASLPFVVRLYANQTRLGAVKNYEQALGHCNADADVIVLCDQDDFWRPDKLVRIEKTFSASPNVGLLFSDAELIDEQGTSLNQRLWQYTFKKNHKRQVRSGKAFEILLQHHIVTGATMAFRGRFKEMVLPIPGHIPLLHDGWIALIISAIADVAMLEEPLIAYRLHPQQHSGIKRSTQAESNASLKNISPLGMRSRYYTGEIEKLCSVQERLTGMLRAMNDPQLQEKSEQRIAYVEALLSHFRVRAGLPEERWRRKEIVLKELLAFRYHRYSKGFMSVLRDLTI
jgi:glycosyltransferase involved in cell wall biosynthesis